jgi:hypothetical protein
MESSVLFYLLLYFNDIYHISLMKVEYQQQHDKCVHIYLINHVTYKS